MVLIDFLKKLWTIVHGLDRFFDKKHGLYGFDRFFEKSMDYSSWF